MRDLIVPVLRKRWADARVIHELPLRYSSNRIDLAAVTPSEIISVEIKSSRDTSDRLEAQIRAFLPVSARVIVALAPADNLDLPGKMQSTKGGSRWVKHWTEAQAILERIGSGQHIERWTVCHETGRIEQPYWDRRYQVPWTARMLDMLWNSELETITGGRTGTHEYLVRVADMTLTGAAARRAVCRALRARAAFDVASDPPIPWDASQGEQT
jgi:hypothetical protein